MSDSNCSSTLTYFTGQPDGLCVPENNGSSSKSNYPVMNTYYNSNCDGTAAVSTTYSETCVVNDINMNGQTNYKAIRTAGQATNIPSAFPSAAPTIAAPTTAPTIPAVYTSGYYITYNYSESGACYGNSQFNGYALNICVYIGPYFAIYTCNGGKLCDSRSITSHSCLTFDCCYRNFEHCILYGFSMYYRIIKSIHQKS